MCVIKVRGGRLQRLRSIVVIWINGYMGWSYDCYMVYGICYLSGYMD
jgi:hypothetical protein